ncbi:ATP-binding cassette domain-containing protein [Candidatus Peregrinibacteria bacterium]|nr:MAG: ATP-binding cassette domain-containing protein [Candidatus Peregrinibacteria bacterium]
MKEKLAHLPEIKFRFHSIPFKANVLLQTHNLGFGYDDDDLLIDSFSFSAAPGDRIAVIGRNGRGKSTLLKLLVGTLQPTSGKIVRYPELQIGYFGADSKDDLNEHRTVLEELVTLPGIKEQEARNVCGSLLFTGDAVKKKISQLSGGEKSRVCLGKVILFSSHILVLDEPTNHLDMESCQALIDSLNRYTGTVILVTHDEDLITRVANRLVVFDSGEVRLKNYNYATFLEKDGWSGEDSSEFKSLKPASENKQQYLDKKERVQQLRANQKQQRTVEKSIETLTLKHQSLAIDLQAACEQKQVESIKELGMKSKAMADEIDACYEQLEQLLVEAERLADETT